MREETNQHRQSSTDPIEQTPGKGKNPIARPIEPQAPEEFGLVQLWWGDGKGKTTAAMGMGFRAAGHGYRVHMVQLMKGGASSVEDVRGEYNAIETFPGFSYENLGHYGWHGMRDGSADDDHEVHAQAGFTQAREIVEASRSVTGPIAPDAPATDGVHMLIIDEILYATNRELVDIDSVIEMIQSKPDSLELILTGGHSEPTAIAEYADLVSHVKKQKHPIDAGQRARKGTEY